MLTLRGDGVDDLLMAFLEPLLEGLFEYLLAGICDLLLRAVKAVFKTEELPSAWLAALGYVLLGLVIGGLNLIWFPVRLTRRSRIPGASLIASPLMTGLMMSWTGSFLRRRNERVTRIESFGYGCAFAFGVALIRFLWAK